MKPLQGDSVHNNSCSCTSCDSKSESERQTFKRLLVQGSRINRLLTGKYHSHLKQSQLLDKLIKTRALYDALRSQLLSSSESSAADLKPRQSSREMREAFLKAKKSSDIFALVDLVDKGAVTGMKKLSECCSCCTCSSKFKLSENVQKNRRTRQVHASGKTPSRSSLVSKQEIGEAKNIKSDPCTCACYGHEKIKKPREIFDKILPGQRITERDCHCTASNDHKVLSLNNAMLRKSHHKLKRAKAFRSPYMENIGEGSNDTKLKLKLTHENAIKQIDSLEMLKFTQKKIKESLKTSPKTLHKKELDMRSIVQKTAEGKKSKEHVNEKRKIPSSELKQRLAHRTRKINEGRKENTNKSHSSSTSSSSILKETPNIPGEKQHRRHREKKLKRKHNLTEPNTDITEKPKKYTLEESKQLQKSKESNINLVKKLTYNSTSTKKPIKKSKTVITPGIEESISVSPIKKSSPTSYKQSASNSFNQINKSKAKSRSSVLIRRKLRLLSAPLRYRPRPPVSKETRRREESAHPKKQSSVKQKNLKASAHTLRRCLCSLKLKINKTKSKISKKVTNKDQNIKDKQNILLKNLLLPLKTLAKASNLNYNETKCECSDYVNRRQAMKRNKRATQNDSNTHLENKVADDNQPIQFGPAKDISDKTNLSIHAFITDCVCREVEEFMYKHRQRNFELGAKPTSQHQVHKKTDDKLKNKIKHATSIHESKCECFHDNIKNSDEKGMYKLPRSKSITRLGTRLTSKDASITTEKPLKLQNQSVQTVSNVSSKHKRPIEVFLRQLEKKKNHNPRSSTVLFNKGYSRDGPKVIQSKDKVICECADETNKFAKDAFNLRRCFCTLQLRKQQKEKYNKKNVSKFQPSKVQSLSSQNKLKPSKDNMLPYEYDSYSHQEDGKKSKKIIKMFTSRSMQLCGIKDMRSILISHKSEILIPLLGINKTQSSDISHNRVRTSISNNFFKSKRSSCLCFPIVKDNKTKKDYFENDKNRHQIIILDSKSGEQTLLPDYINNRHCTLKLRKKGKYHKKLNLVNTDTKCNIFSKKISFNFQRGPKLMDSKYINHLAPYESKQMKPFKLKKNKSKTLGTETKKAIMKSKSSDTRSLRSNSGLLNVKSDFQQRNTSFNKFKRMRKYSELSHLPQYDREMDTFLKRRRVNLGSNFSFNIEFYKGISHETNLNQNRTKNMKDHFQTRQYGASKNNLLGTKRVSPVSNSCYCTLQMSKMDEHRRSGKSFTPFGTKELTQVYAVNTFAIARNKIKAPEILKTDHDHCIDSLYCSTYCSKNTSSQSKQWRYFKENRTCGFSISMIEFKAKHKLQISSRNESLFHFSSNELMRFESAFSCNIDNIESQTTKLKIAQSNDRFALKQCLAKNCEIEYAKNVNNAPQMTGVQPLLRRSYCTMNIHVGRKRKLLDYECEPGICIPDECDPYECQKLIMKRLMRKVSRMSGTESKSKSSSVETTSSSGSRVKKLQSDRVREPKHRARGHDPRRFPRSRPARPQGLTYQTLPRTAAAPVAGKRQVARVGSKFSFNMEFSKGSSISATGPPSPPPPAEFVRVPRRQISSRSSMTYPRYGMDRGTKYRNRRQNRETQSIMRQMRHRASSVTPMLKRCFCTLKLQKKGRKQKEFESQSIEHDSQGTSTPTEFQEEVPVLRTTERGQNTSRKRRLLPYECEPGICVPGECDPYECLELIKRRNIHTRDSGTDSMASSVTSSSMTYGQKRKRKQIQARRFRERPVRSRTTSVRSKPSGVTMDTISRQGQPRQASHSQGSRQAVKISSNFSFNIEFYKDCGSCPEPYSEIYTKPYKTSEVSVQQIPREFRKVHRGTYANRKMRRNTYSQEGTSTYDDGSQIGIYHRGQSTMTTGYPQRCFCTAQLQGLNVDAATEARPYRFAKLKRCFCTLKLMSAYQRQLLKDGNMGHDGYSVTRRRIRGAQTRRFEPEYEGPAQTQTRRLLPYECEPGVCEPGFCDPNECIKLIRRRLLRDQMTGMRRPRTTSTSSYFSSSNPSRARMTQSRSYGPRTRTTQSGYARRRRRKRDYAPREYVIQENVSAPERQAVKIGSNFSFNIEFYKDTGSTNRNMRQAVAPIVRHYPAQSRSAGIRYRPTPVRDRGHGAYRRMRTRDRGLRGRRFPTFSRDSQMDPIQRRNVGLGPILRRCFCTLQLKKKSKRKNDIITSKAVSKTVSKNMSKSLSKAETKTKTRAEAKARTKTKTKAEKKNETVSKTGNKDEAKEESEAETKPRSKTKTKGKTKTKTETQKELESETKPSSKAKGKSKGKTKTETQAEIQTETKAGSKTKTKSKKNVVSKAVSKAMSKVGPKVTSKSVPKVGSAVGSKAGSKAGSKVPSKIGSRDENKAETKEKPIQNETETPNQKTTNKRHTCLCPPPVEEISPSKSKGSTETAKKLEKSIKSAKKSEGSIKSSKKSDGSKSAKDSEGSTIITTKPKGRYRHARRHYECEPGVCVPGECDPYRCLKRINKRLMYSSGTSNDRHHTRHAANIAKHGRGNRDSVSQSLIQRKKPKRTRDKRQFGATSKPLKQYEVRYVGTPQRISSRSTERQSTYFRNRRAQNSRTSRHVDSQAEIETETKAGSKAKTKTVSKSKKNVGSKASSKSVPKVGSAVDSKAGSKDENKAETKEKPIQNETEPPKQKTTNKRHTCLCPPPVEEISPSKSKGSTETAKKLEKSIKSAKKSEGRIKSSKKSDRSKSAKISEGSTIIATKPKGRYRHARRHYECEPGVCVPGECDPYRCLKRINKRLMYSSGTSTDRHNTRHAANIAKHGKPMRTRKKKQFGSGATSRPLKQYQVRYVDKPRRISSRSTERHSTYFRNRRAQNSRTTRYVNSQTSVSSMSSMSDTVAPFLKRCFCTLQLHCNTDNQGSPFECFSDLSNIKIHKSPPRQKFSTAEKRRYNRKQSQFVQLRSNMENQRYPFEYSSDFSKTKFCKYRPREKILTAGKIWHTRKQSQFVQLRCNTGNQGYPFKCCNDRSKTKSTKELPRDEVSSEEKSIYIRKHRQFSQLRCDMEDQDSHFECLTNYSKTQIRKSLPIEKVSTTDERRYIKKQNQFVQLRCDIGKQKSPFECLNDHSETQNRKSLPREKGSSAEKSRYNEKQNQFVQLRYDVDNQESPFECLSDHSETIIRKRLPREKLSTSIKSRHTRKQNQFIQLRCNVENQGSPFECMSELSKTKRNKKPNKSKETPPFECLSDQSKSKKQKKPNKNQEIPPFECLSDQSKTMKQKASTAEKNKYPKKQFLRRKHEPDEREPGDCDSANCLQKIKKRSKQAGTKTPRSRSNTSSTGEKSRYRSRRIEPRTFSSRGRNNKIYQRDDRFQNDTRSQSISSSSGEKRKFRTKMRSYLPKQRKRYDDQSQDNTISTQQARPVRDNPNREAVRLGSNFNLKIEFFKDQSPKIPSVREVSNIVQHDESIYPKKRSIKKLIFIRPRKTNFSFIKSMSSSGQKDYSKDLKSQSELKKTDSRGTPGTPLLRRCFCKFEKKGKQRFSKSLSLKKSSKKEEPTIVTIKSSSIKSSFKCLSKKVESSFKCVSIHTKPNSKAEIKQETRVVGTRSKNMKMCKCEVKAKKCKCFPKTCHCNKPEKNKNCKCRQSCECKMDPEPSVKQQETEQKSGRKSELDEFPCEEGKACKCCVCNTYTLQLNDFPCKKGKKCICCRCTSAQKTASGKGDHKTVSRNEDRKTLFGKGSKKPVSGKGDQKIISTKEDQDVNSVKQDNFPCKKGKKCRCAICKACNNQARSPMESFTQHKVCKCATCKCNTLDLERSEYPCKKGKECKCATCKCNALALERSEYPCKKGKECKCATCKCNALALERSEYPCKKGKECKCNILALQTNQVPCKKGKKCKCPTCKCNTSAVEKAEQPCEKGTKCKCCKCNASTVSLKEDPNLIPIQQDKCGCYKDKSKKCKCYTDKASKCDCEGPKAKKCKCYPKTCECNKPEKNKNCKCRQSCECKMVPEPSIKPSIKPSVKTSIKRLIKPSAKTFDKKTSVKKMSDKKTSTKSNVCERGRVCEPGECTPNTPMKSLKKSIRQKLLRKPTKIGIFIKRAPRRSISGIAAQFLPGYTHKRTKYRGKHYSPEKVERIVEEPRYSFLLGRDARQGVKITSNFSFNIEFFKEMLPPVMDKIKEKVPPDMDYNSPRHVRRRPKHKMLGSEISETLSSRTMLKKCFCPFKGQKNTHSQFLTVGRAEEIRPMTFFKPKEYWVQYQIQQSTKKYYKRNPQELNTITSYGPGKYDTINCHEECCSRRKCNFCSVKSTKQGTQLVHKNLEANQSILRKAFCYCKTLFKKRSTKQITRNSESKTRFKKNYNMLPLADILKPSKSERHPNKSATADLKKSKSLKVAKFSANGYKKKYSRFQSGDHQKTKLQNTGIKLVKLNCQHCQNKLKQTVPKHENIRSRTDKILKFKPNNAVVTEQKKDSKPVSYLFKSQKFKNSDDFEYLKLCSCCGGIKRIKDRAASYTFIDTNNKILKYSKDTLVISKDTVIPTEINKIEQETALPQKNEQAYPCCAWNSVMNPKTKKIKKRECFECIICKKEAESCKKHNRRGTMTISIESKNDTLSSESGYYPAPNKTNKKKKLQHESIIRRNALNNEFDKKQNQLENPSKDSYISDSLLVAESIFDVDKFELTSIEDNLCNLNSVVSNSKDINHACESNLHKPKSVWQTCQKAISNGPILQKLQRLKLKCQTRKCVTEDKENNDHPVTHFTRQSKKLSRWRRSGSGFGWSPFVLALRKKPWLNAYCKSANLHSRCLSILQVWRNFLDIVLFLSAIAVWSPCLLGKELCRALKCCFSCSG